MDYYVNGMLIEMVEETEHREAEKEQMKRLMQYWSQNGKEGENNDTE